MFSMVIHATVFIPRSNKGAERERILTGVVKKTTLMVSLNG